MFKRFLFQTHWFIGITAGLVLAVVGLTGSILSFESNIQQWLNRDVRLVEPLAKEPLAPAALLSELQKQYPGRRVIALSLSGVPNESAQVTFALPGSMPAAVAPAGRGAPRGENRYANPYTGVLIAGAGTRGLAFFRTVRSVHRWLTAGDFGNQQIGKQLVGASTLLCVFLALSGLYLRWPRRRGSWRTWLTFDPALKGRSFLWHLHAVLGTWVLVGFLLISLTGLYWSYDWYRNGLYTLAGVERPAPRGELRAAPDAGARERLSGTPRDRANGGARATVDLDAVWASFRKETAAAGFSVAMLALPQAGRGPLEIRYKDADPAYDRAWSTLVLDAATGAVVRHELYAEKRTGEKFMASIFPLHSGSFFGVPGLLAYMLASLSMPAFTVTGWMMYLGRRRKKRAAKIAHRESVASGPGPAPGKTDILLLAFASQTGGAREFAWQTAGSLQAAGVPVDVQPLARLSLDRLQQTRRALFVVSTFGGGEPPDEAKSFVRRAMRASAALSQMQFGVLALGDKQYKTFCEFGHTLEQWLRRHGAQAFFPMVEVDNGDPKALAHWLERLGAIAGTAALPAWKPAAYHDWQLTGRSLMNAGSVGGSTFHLELAAPSAQDMPAWKAGDIVEIQPANSRQALLGFLARHGLDGSAAVESGEGRKTLAESLKYAVLPTGLQVSLPSLAQNLEPLPMREFSIASIPQDGRLHLVVRQTHRDDGNLGLGSGWLTAFAAPGDAIRLRIRANPGFHAPEDSRPLVLIGNGTGIAGLRSHLKARMQAGHARNWLIFGERNRSRDFYYEDEIAAWQSGQWLQRVDLAFSRDQPERIYVQHILFEQAGALQAWITDGAAIYVCGSAEGMAQGVQAALVQILGQATLERLAEEGRYRRDVY